MKNIYKVGILLAAYSEASNIERLITSILASKWQKHVEFKLLIATASNDTLDLSDPVHFSRKEVSKVASRYGKLYPESVIHLDDCVCGKNDALNRLFQHCSDMDIYVILDADIMIADESVLPNLVNNIISKGYYLASAFVMTHDTKYKFPFDHLASVYNKRLPSRYKYARYANGRLFAVHGGELRKIAKNGVIFPNRHILDDMFIGIHIPWEKIIMDTNCHAFMIYFNSFKDYIDFKKSKKRGSVFLQNEYPELYDRRQRDFANAGLNSLMKTSYGMDKEVDRILTTKEKIIATIEKHIIRMIAEQSVAIKYGLFNKVPDGRHCQDRIRHSTKRSFD